MKKKIQAIACAAMLAVGGMNAYMAIGSGITESELKIDGVEALGYPEYTGYVDPLGDYKDWISRRGTCWYTEYFFFLPGAPGNEEWDICGDDGSWTPKCSRGSTMHTIIYISDKL